MYLSRPSPKKTEFAPGFIALELSDDGDEFLLSLIPFGDFPGDFGSLPFLRGLCSSLQPSPL